MAPRPGRCGPAEGHVLEGKEEHQGQKGQGALPPPVLAHAGKAFTALKKKSLATAKKNYINHFTSIYQIYYSNLAH